MVSPGFVLQSALPPRGQGSVSFCGCKIISQMTIWPEQMVSITAGGCGEQGSTAMLLGAEG